MNLIVLYFFVIGLICGAILFSAYNKKIYFNSSAVNINNTRDFSPEFEVVAVEQYLDIKFNVMAKYTVKNHFFAKKGNKDFKYQTFYFFDRIGKYEIGQILTLK